MISSARSSEGGMRFSLTRSDRSATPLLLAAISIVIAASVAIGSNQTRAQEPSAAELRDQAYNPGAPPDPAAVSRGQRIYQSTCAFCHGSDATGGTGPNLLDIPVVLLDRDGHTLGEFLHNGLPDSGMPAFPAVTTAQAADISAFLHAQSRIAADRFAQQATGVIAGDAAAGKAYFNGPARCSGCHSPTGDLAGIAAKYRPEMLMSRICYPSARTGVGKAAAIVTTAYVTLASGQEVTGTLIHQDEFNIVLGSADGSHHVYSLAAATVRLNDPLAAHAALVTKYTDSDLHNLVAYLETLK